MKQLFIYIFYPASLVFSVGASLFLISTFSPSYLVLVPGVISISFALLFFILEKKFPFRTDWRINQGDLNTDLIQTFFTLPFAAKISEYIIPVLLFYPIVWATSYLPAYVVLENHNLFSSFVIGLVCCEFFYYWAHRIGHISPLFWRFHSVHHGANRVYWANSGRFHFIDAVWGSCAYLLPLVFLKASPETVALILSFSAVTGFLEHVNINFKAGYLNYIFNSAELHRWHHSEIMNESNTNYGKALIIWDLVFGTFYLPKNQKVSKTGIEGESVPTTFIGQLIYPFQKI